MFIVAHARRANCPQVNIAGSMIPHTPAMIPGAYDDDRRGDSYDLRSKVTVRAGKFGVADRPAPIQASA
jgi:hypothetical protein